MAVAGGCLPTPGAVFLARSSCERTAQLAGVLCGVARDGLCAAARLFLDLDEARLACAAAVTHVAVRNRDALDEQSVANSALRCDDSGV